MNNQPGCARRRPGWPRALAQAHWGSLTCHTAMPVGEAALSLTEREQRILSRIAEELARTAPALVTLLSGFNRLALGEAMPPRRPLRRLRRRLSTVALSRTVVTVWMLTTVGMVAADGAVFRGTLAENIRYKCPGAAEDAVLEAAIAAGLGITLERLAQGLGTELGEGGAGLSVGERQRLQIARILVDRPRILVLDEATANLDYVTENEVKQALGGLAPRPTTLVIAHRYSMVKDADHVVVLDQGRVVEQGSPRELMAAGGWFARLAAQSALDAASRRSG